MAAPSQDQSYDQTRFRNKAAEELYRSLFEKKGVAVERGIDLDKFRGRPYHLADEIEGRNWGTFAKFKGTSIAILCREFMANVSTHSNVQGEERLESWVRGVRVVITPNTFCEILSLPRVRNPQFGWPGIAAEWTEDVVGEIFKPGTHIVGTNQIKKKYLNERYLPLFLWTCYSMLPLARVSEVSVMRGQLMWAIGTGLRIDLPLYLFLGLYSAYTEPDPVASIPFSCILTKVITDSGAQFPATLVQTKSLGHITATTISRSKSQFARGSASGSSTAQIT